MVFSRFKGFKIHCLNGQKVTILQKRQTMYGLQLHVKEPVFYPIPPTTECTFYFVPASWCLEAQNAMQNWQKATAGDWKSIMDSSFKKIDIKHLKIFMQHQWRQSANFLRVVSTVILNGVLQKQRKELVQENIGILTTTRKCSIGKLKMLEKGRRKARSSNHYVTHLIHKWMRRWTILFATHCPKIKVVGGSWSLLYRVGSALGQQRTQGADKYMSDICEMLGMTMSTPQQFFWSLWQRKRSNDSRIQENPTSKKQTKQCDA
jgi:hypothetical protein